MTPCPKLSERVVHFFELLICVGPLSVIAFTASANTLAPLLLQPLEHIRSVEDVLKPAYERVDLALKIGEALERREALPAIPTRLQTGSRLPAEFEKAARLLSDLRVPVADGGNAIAPIPGAELLAGANVTALVDNFGTALTWAKSRQQTLAVFAGVTAELKQFGLKSATARAAFQQLARFPPKNASQDALQRANGSWRQLGFDPAELQTLFVLNNGLNDLAKARHATFDLALREGVTSLGIYKTNLQQLCRASGNHVQKLLLAKAAETKSQPLPRRLEEIETAKKAVQLEADACRQELDSLKREGLDLDQARKAIDTAIYRCPCGRPYATCPHAGPRNEFARAQTQRMDEFNRHAAQFKIKEDAAKVRHDSLMQRGLTLNAEEAAYIRADASARHRQDFVDDRSQQALKANPHLTVEQLKLTLIQLESIDRQFGSILNK